MPGDVPSDRRGSAEPGRVEALIAGLTRIRLLNLREIRTHRLRLFTSLAVVVVSSALLIAVLGTYGSTSESVRDFNNAVSGTADIEVAGITSSGVDQSLAGEIRRDVDGAKAVVPMIRGSVVIDDSSVPLLGSDQRVTQLSGDLRAAVAQEQSGTIDVDRLRTGVFAGPGLGLERGQKLTVSGVEVEVLEVIDNEQAARLNNGRFIFAYVDLAQRLVGLEGRLDSILIVTEPGADVGAVRSEIEGIVDGRAVVVDPDFRAKQAEVASSVTRDATLLVSLVSLVIAAFLVFNTMNMAVASRRRSLAMIRALGGKRSHLVGDMLGEAALMGLVGGVLGIPLGILAGRAVISSLPEPPPDTVGTVINYHLPGYAPAVAVIACVLACVAATTLAARSVFSVSPVEAMAPVEVSDSAARRGPAVVVAGVVGVAGVIAAWVIVSTVPGRPAILAGVFYLVGALLVCFAVSKPLSWAVVRVARWFAGPGRLASVNTERAPRRAWATLMTVAVAIAVGIGTSGALDNLVSSMSKSLDGLGDPDFYVSSSSAAGLPLGPILPASLAGEVAAVPGVTEVVGGQWAAVNIGESKANVQGLEPDSRAPFMRKASPEAVAQVLAGDGILLSNVLARVLDVTSGDTVELATPSGPRQAVVRDTVDYVSLDSGVAAMSQELLGEWYDRAGDTYLQVITAPGADPEQIQRQLELLVADIQTTGNKPISVYSGAEALKATQATVQQAGAFAVAIQWIVAGAAAIALLNTLLLSVLERRRELGVLRAMGASRKFISRMVLAEAGAVALVGSVLGAVLGTLMHLLSNEILSITTSLTVIYSPRPSALLFIGIAVALCLIGAFVPAVRAARMNISESIQNE
ncbi:FtsX-like permease family protein [Gordonia jinghuaiqii]|uniref:ABC transporter permease n=1 Tax=Gordonia jinghuaiqii TaxID=2758710 RepID=A0A7D7LSR7_9ACTN|nr:ABC transporter permease [Gordonia jinghuaiqii]MCR5977804.1 FtsX-like permease family protein [Gordonia jinghuaiqii]QMT02463.1 ABC transporter permease [Gordonia jinghuaiqii]